MYIYVCIYVYMYIYVYIYIYIHICIHITLLVNKRNCAEKITSKVSNNCQIKYLKIYIALIILYLSGRWTAGQIQAQLQIKQRWLQDSTNSE